MGITGGNWKIGKHNSCVVTDDKKAIDFEKRDTPESVEYYGGALIAESCREADAKLIAAAPDLLEELTLLLAYVEKVGDESGFWPENEQIRDCHRAIEKATV